MSRWQSPVLNAAVGCGAVAALIGAGYFSPASGQRVSASASVSASAGPMVGSRIHVIVNGQRVRFPDQQPVMIRNRVLVPLRGVFEALGARVDWNPSDETVTATRDGREVRLRINNTTASVNGRPITMDVPAGLIGGRTMVPLRFVSEAIGADVRWVDATQSVIIRMGDREPMAQGGGDENGGQRGGGTAPANGNVNTVSSGPALFVRDCGRCHTLGNLGSGRIGLNHVGARRSLDWLEVQIRDPQQHGSAMPAFPPSRLSNQDLYTLSLWLENQK